MEKRYIFSALIVLILAFVLTMPEPSNGQALMRNKNRYTRPDPKTFSSKASITAKKTTKQRINQGYDNGNDTSIGNDGCPDGMVRDLCGTCGGNNEACTDCNGDVFGKAHMDCGQCIGGKTSFPDKTRRDCKGNCFGNAKTDNHGTCCYPQERDQCGVCFGRDECVDCHGHVNGTATYDDCGTCSGGNTGMMPNTDKDCNGVCFGAARIDDCNVCAGGDTGRQPNSNKDCKGVCFGSAKYDVCMVCDGDGSTCTGCDGLPNSEAKLDFCGKCKGDNSSCCGPFGNCNNRGVCSRSNNGECSCDLGWTGKFCTIKADMCRWQDCGDHGTCSPSTGECVCEREYMGDHCEFSTCSFHGVTDLDHNGVCNCFPGYTGADCSYCGKPSIEGTEYVCITNYNQDINNMQVDEHRSRNAGYAVAKPISFTLFALKKEKVARALIGDHPLTIQKGKMAILPGTSINGTVYGCDCKPATPYEDSVNFSAGDGSDDENKEKKDEEEQTIKKEEDEKEDDKLVIEEMDAVTLKQVLSRLPFSKLENFDKYVRVYKRFKPGLLIRNHKRDVTTRALTANEANTFLNELFDFFNEEADAFTDTPETVGQAVDNIQDSVDDQLTATVTYFGVTTGLVLLLISVAIITIIFVTGGDFLNLRYTRLGQATGAGGSGGYEGGYEGGGYEGGYA